MRIVGFVGFQGDGKTLSMTHQLLRKKQLQARRIKTNYHTTITDEILPPPKVGVGDSLNYGDIVNTVLGIDEIHAWFDSYCSLSDQNRILSYFFTQLRKRRNDLFWSSQHYMQVGKRLRDNTHYLVICRNVIKQCKGTHTPECSPTADDFAKKCAGTFHPTNSNRSCRHFVQQKWYKAPFYDSQTPYNTKYLKQEPIWLLYNTDEIIQPIMQRKVKGRRLDPTDPDSMVPI